MIIPIPAPNPTDVRMGGYRAAGPRRCDARQVPQQFGEAGAVHARPADRGSNSRCRTVYHTFRTGHRIMVQVQSTWFPLVDRNPQTFVDIYRPRKGIFTRRPSASTGRRSCRRI